MVSLWRRCGRAAMALAYVSSASIGPRPTLSALGSQVEIAPTSVPDSVLRGGPGAFGAPRSEGKKHTGVDIVSRQSSQDKSVFRVMAVSSGVVAYAGYNGEVSEGYGYTVVIDHTNNIYTLYGHLATLASASMVKVGDRVKRGQIIGYMADLANGERSSGNVLAQVVGKYDKIQLHFEVFRAPAGRFSRASINKDIKKLDFQLIDPTSELSGFGYANYNE